MILYLDNIRGFSRQAVQLNEANFLVGENSTGKSSVISLISLFSDVGFSFSGDFKSQFVDFGPFSEIVNKGRNVEVFTIGFKKQSSNLNSLQYEEVLLNYREQEGFPALASVSFRVKNKVLTIAILKEGVKYQLKKSDLKDSLKEWVEDHAERKHIILEGELQLNDRFPKTVPKFTRLANYLPFYISSDSKSHLLDEFRETNLFSDTWLSSTIWIDPLRSKPQRIYEPKKMTYSAEGEHIPTILRDIFLTKDQEESQRIIKGLEKFGKASGLFDEVKIDQYRKSNDSPFALIFKLKNKNLKITNVGYGISQIIPILTEILRQKDKSVFLVQQPEVHLHPRSQAFFGEFIFDQFIEHKKKFVVETHSDFIIDRFRLKMQRSGLKGLSKKVNVLFFETNGKNNTVSRIKLDDKGNYSDDQPKKFREFFLKEEIELLGF